MKVDGMYEIPLYGVFIVNDPSILFTTRPGTDIKL